MGGGAAAPSRGQLTAALSHRLRDQLTGGSGRLADEQRQGTFLFAVDGEVDRVAAELLKLHLLKIKKEMRHSRVVEPAHLNFNVGIQGRHDGAAVSEPVRQTAR